MIDFNNYPEQPEYLVQKTTHDSMSPTAPFKENLFDEKRQMYIEAIVLSNKQLREELLQAAAGFKAETNLSTQAPYITGYTKCIEWLDILSTRNPELLFSTVTKGTQAYYNGLDLCYDMYRSIPSYTSKLQGLSTFEEYFVEMLPNVYNVLNQVFNTIGTRGQLMGYSETELNSYLTQTRAVKNSIQSGTNYQEMLTTIENEFSQWDTMHNQFVSNVSTAQNDIKLLLEPVVIYINLIQLASDINSSVWGNFNARDTIKDTFSSFGTDGVTAEDYILRNKAISAQMTTNSLDWIKPDRSNFELMLTKAIKLTYNEAGIRTKLQQARANLIDPSYS